MYILHACLLFGGDLFFSYMALSGGKLTFGTHRSFISTVPFILTEVGADCKIMMRS